LPDVKLESAVKKNMLHDYGTVIAAAITFFKELERIKIKKIFGVEVFIERKKLSFW
jgi:hypothetical protein